MVNLKRKNWGFFFFNKMSVLQLFTNVQKSEKMSVPKMSHMLWIAHIITFILIPLTVCQQIFNWSAIFQECDIKWKKVYARNVSYVANSPYLISYHFDIQHCLQANFQLWLFDYIKVQKWSFLAKMLSWRHFNYGCWGK